MQKGFEFWASKRISLFLRTYWILFCIYYVLSVWFSIYVNNAFLYLILGSIPYPIVLIYRVVHDPYYGLEESIKEIDPEFYTSLLEHAPKLPIYGKIRKPKQRKGLLYSAIWKMADGHMDQRIAVFIRNGKKIQHSAQLSLFVWFITFIVLFFALFFLE